ncbi:PilW family protein [Comamonas endophytica]|uniref:PilW family protein n=1 Tax=Comamonas endophytica TaxID=2949090 RepID=A0ABY6GBW2_9BURK|nr:MULTISPECIES: PilW family protein [unclassified Acidovorax]MCD2513578.1 PilW family protein [Acidovorax sp. D4N7]UYG52413.1 PilW family protein [Acidovorax sp. 5MLIR]
MRRTPALHSKRRQRGLTLLELLVGLTIGLMTITVAIGTLMISRQVSGTTSEASQLQQQAAQALRTIGQQARQAGSLRLNLAYAKDSAQAVDLADPVAFELPAGMTTVSGRDTPSASEDQLTLAYQNYTEEVVGSATPQSQFRDCLGQGKDASVIRSGFSLDKAAGATSGELECKGSDGITQPVIENVADFRVRFVEQTGSFGSPAMRYRTADSLTAAEWPRIQAIEVCLEMEGSENLPESGQLYLNCANQSVARGTRLRMVLRSTYQIRSQGRPSGVQP